MVVILCSSVMVGVSGCGLIVIVRRGPVMVLRVIVPGVVVDVESRPHGHRRGHGLNEHECDDPAHGVSLLWRPALRPGFAATLASTEQNFAGPREGAGINPRQNTTTW